LNPIDDFEVRPYKINLAIEPKSINNKMENYMEALNKEGIEETLDIFKFFVGIGNTVKSVTAEDSAGGKSVTLMEDLQFIPDAKNAIAAVVGIAKIPAEVMDTITPDEYAQLEAVINESKFIPDDLKNGAVKKILKWTVDTKNLIFELFPPATKEVTPA
jgi:hypothetical protein